LAFSYWIDNLGFITEGKLAAIFIKPSLGVSNWPVIYFINYTPTSSLAPFITAPSTSFLASLPGIEEEEAPTSNTRSPVNLAPSNAIKFSGAVAGEKEDFCKGSFARTSFTLFKFCFTFTCFVLSKTQKN
jgi:hypothetical protein